MSEVSVRTSGRQLGRSALLRARRQVDATWERVRRPHLDGPYVRRRDRGLPLVARVDPGLHLARLHDALVARVTEELTARGADHWWWPPAPGSGDVLNLPASGVPVLLDVLTAVADDATYVDLLDELGSPGRRRRVDRLPAEEVYAGLLVWPHVVAAPGSTFASGPGEGFRVHVWDPLPRGRLHCRVRNLVALDLPADPAQRAPVLASLRLPTTGQVEFPIDVVYTWVDGTDPAWAAAKAHASGAVDPEASTERAQHEARWADHDELRFSLRALEQFAPWVRHVWVVTADQHPAWLVRDHPWVTVVPHRAIWPDGQGLPTFNSHAIETCLHRVPGLSEHFLYLNDDMVLGRPVRPEQFFEGSGVSRFFWSSALVDHGPSAPGDVASTTAARTALRLLQERYGRSFTRKFFHTAAALTVSGLAELEATFPEVVGATRRARFRTLDDVATAGSFYLNWAYLTGRAVPGELRYAYVDPADRASAARLPMIARTRAFDAICVNDGSTDETAEQRRRTDRLIRDFLASYLPVPGSFETAG